MLRFVGAALAGGLFGALVLVLLMTRLLGYHVLTVESGSMFPALQRGDLIVTRPEPISSANVGDIVVFDQGEQVHLAVVHRVVSYTNVNLNVTDTRTGKTSTSHTRILTTKGDANPQPDAQSVDQSRFLGAVWFSLPRVGSLLGDRFVRFTLIVIVAVCALALVLTEVRPIWLRRRPGVEKQG